MKHACEHCGQKYAIPDQRVAGKYLKVRCRKCSGVMAVDGSHVVVGSTSIIPQLSRVIDTQPIREWYIAVAGKPQGPYTKNQIIGLIEWGEVRARTLMWKGGMEKWERVCESDKLGWVLVAVQDRERRADANVYRSPSGLFETVPAALVQDGRAYFPDPTMHSGWTVLSEEARAYLESVAKRERRHDFHIRFLEAAAYAVAFLTLTLLGAASAWAATGF